MKENKDAGMPAQAVRTGGTGKKMSTKDYVTVGIFALLHTAVLFIVGAIGGLSAGSRCSALSASSPVASSSSTS